MSIWGYAILETLGTFIAIVCWVVWWRKNKFVDDLRKPLYWVAILLPIALSFTKLGIAPLAFITYGTIALLDKEVMAKRQQEDPFRWVFGSAIMAAVGVILAMMYLPGFVAKLFP